MHKTTMNIKNTSNDIKEFTNFLEQNNELGREEDLKKLGIKL